MSQRRADLNRIDVQPGDIFACYGTDWISRGISLETSLTSWVHAPPGLRWSPSHVAIAATRFQPGNDDCYWYESTSQCFRLCLESGRQTEGVQVHCVRDRLRDYVMAGGRVDQYRLTKLAALDHLTENKLRHLLMKFVGSENTPAAQYDTIGAAFSGLRVLPWLPFSRADLESLFCSELIAAVLQQLCLMNRNNPARFNPGRLLRTLVRQGTYSRLRKIEGVKHVIAT